MSIKRKDIEDYLSEISLFLGVKWFEEQFDSAGEIPDPQSTHPLVYAYVKAINFLKFGKKSLPGLNLTPTQELLIIIIVGKYLRLLHGCSLVDDHSNSLEFTIQNYFQSRLKDKEQYHATLYEIQIACQYIRAGYEVKFIHDDRKKSPEFFATINGNKVYVECKMINKRMSTPKISAVCNRIIKKVKNLLIKSTENLGVLVICKDDFSNQEIWVKSKLKELIKGGRVPCEIINNDLILKIFKLPAPVEIKILDGHVSEFSRVYYNDVLEPYIHRHYRNARIIYEHALTKINCKSRSHQIIETEGYFGVAITERTNIISGIRNLIKKASRQLPENEVGVVYVKAPPYAATDEEIKTFSDDIKRAFRGTTRITALVLTGELQLEKKYESFSNIIINDNCAVTFPEGSNVIALKETYNII